MIATLVRLPDERLRSLLDDPDEAYDAIVNGDDPCLSLDKSWDGIRFLLVERFPDAALAPFLTQGGQPVGDDFGYGPGRGFFSNQVDEIARLLRDAPVPALREAYAPIEMAGVYPSVWDRDPEQEFEALSIHYEALRTFIESSLGQSIVVWIA